MTLGQRLVLMRRFPDSGEAPGGHSPVSLVAYQTDSESYKHVSSEVFRHINPYSQQLPALLFVFLSQ